MGRNQAQRRRTVRLSVKGAPAYRASRIPRPRRVSFGVSVPRRAARRRTVAETSTRGRRRLLFHVLVASVAAQLAAAFAGCGALLALFTLLGLLLSAVVIRS